MKPLLIEYLVKEALAPGVVAGVAGGLGRFLTKTMPNAFRAIQSGAGKIGLNTATTATKNMPLGMSKAMMTTTGVGAAGGAIKGAVDAPEGQKGKGALKGALIGGAIGAATGAAANKLPTLGNQISQDFNPAGRMLSAAAKANPNMTMKNLAQGSMDWAAKNMGDRWQKIPTGAGPNVKNFFGGTTKATERLANQPLVPGGPITHKSLAARAVGSGATTGKAMQDKGLIEGAVSRIGDNWTRHRSHDAKIGLNTFKAPRSGAGQIVAPLMMSGAGMGAMTALQSKNEDGTQRSMGTRIRKGATDAVGWGLAAPAMGTKALYDVSKAFRPKKLQQNLNQ